MTDAISRQSVVDMLDETRRIAERNVDGAVLMTFERVLDSLVNITNALPTIQPAEPKRGKWIRDGHHIRCGQCGMYMCDTDREGDRIPTEFCPHCGADMREVNHESN